MSPKAETDASLKRLGGGRWQTRDERFTIEPQSGTWVVVDAEQTDDLGLPLVRGPFGSLGSAKEAIAEARVAEPAVSPLAGRAPKRATEQDAGEGTATEGTTSASTRGREARKATPHATDAPKRGASKRPARPTPAEPEPEPEPEPESDPEPRWITELEPDERRRARTLIERLTAAGAPDPEGLARRDIVGDVPAVATFALIHALRDLGEDAAPAAVLDALADGRDRALGVRWRLVDGEGRRITLDPEALQLDE